MNNRCFQIWKISVGWICGTLQWEQTKILFEYSYLENFLDDFMLAILTVLGEYPADERKETFFTEMEPGRAKWELSVSGDDIRIHVINYDSDVMLSQKTVTLNRMRFLREFTDEMDAVLQRYGLLGYRMEWESEFPLSLYLRIKDIAAAQNRLKRTVIIPAEDNLGIEVQASSFAAECSILNE